MSEAHIRTIGVFSVRKVLRTAIWTVLVVYAAYLSSAAMAEPATKGTMLDLAPSVGPLGLHDMGKGPGLGGVNRGKAMIFERPTAADPRDELACLALTIYHEARGEPNEGKVAVSHVVMNRVASGRFPDTICDVVRQGGEMTRHRCQFSWWCDGRSDAPRSQADWELSNEIALKVYWGRSVDPTEGALWYHADYVSPKWRHDFETGPKIGRHIFYRTAGEGTKLASRTVSN